MSSLPRGRWRRAGLAVLALGLAGLAAFAVSNRRVELEVGVHRVSVRCPGDFEVVARESGHLFRDGPVLLELEDLGSPVADPSVELPFETWIHWAMSWLETSSQRGVVRTTDLELQGRTFRVVETWDSLTHANRRRFAFAVSGGSMLVLHTRGGDFERSSAAFDHVLASLEFDDA